MVNMSNEMQKKELEQVSGGFNPDRERNPEIEYVCPKCGCKYTHRNPGRPGLCSATCPRCPQCEGIIKGPVQALTEITNNAEK